MNRILAIQIKRIGDLILTAPALASLKRAFPESELTLVTLGAAGQLVPAIPAVDEHFNYRYGRPNLSVWAALMTGRFDGALDFNGNDRSLLMTFLSGAEVRAGYTKRARGVLRKPAYTATSDASLKEWHTIDHMGALLDAFGLPASAEPEPLMLSIPEETGDAAGAMLAAQGVDGPFAVMHPGTARVEKYWEADRWAAVADFLETEAGLPVVITGGRDPEEARHIRAIVSKSEAVPVVVAGQLSLLETAAVIARSELALGVDTAAMHLAAAFEKPQVVLFGPTNPYHWGPRHDRARVLLSGHPEPVAREQLPQKLPELSMKAIEAEQVLGAIDSLGLR